MKKAQFYIGLLILVVVLYIFKFCVSHNNNEDKEQRFIYYGPCEHPDCDNWHYVEVKNFKDNKQGLMAINNHYKNYKNAPFSITYVKEMPNIPIWDWNNIDYTKNWDYIDNEARIISYATTLQELDFGNFISKKIERKNINVKTIKENNDSIVNVIYFAYDSLCRDVLANFYNYIIYLNIQPRNDTLMSFRHLKWFEHEFLSKKVIYLLVNNYQKDKSLWDIKITYNLFGRSIDRSYFMWLDYNTYDIAPTPIPAEPHL